MNKPVANMSPYTEVELTAIHSLKQRLSDLNLDEETLSERYLARWLQAQNFDVKDAEEMFRKSFQWRKEYKIDSILEWSPPPNFYKAFPSELCGYDSDGNAIVVIPMKYFDTNMFWEIEKSDYIKYRIQFIEKIVQGMKNRNKTGPWKGDQVITIHDLEDFNLSSALSSKTLEFLKEVGRLIDENYPEITKASFITYAPRMITFVVSIIKPFLPKGTVSKTKIFGYYKESWAPEILELIPAEVLPPRYGGTNSEFERIAFDGRLNGIDVES